MIDETEHNSGAEPQFKCVPLIVKPPDGPVREYEARYPVLPFTELIPSAHDFIVELAESAPPQARTFPLRWAAAIRFWEYTRRHRRFGPIKNRPSWALPRTPPDEREARTLAKLPEYGEAAAASSQWHEPLLDLGLAASEIPSRVAKAVSERRFTAEFAGVLDDFFGLEQVAHQEVAEKIERSVREEYGDWENVDDCHLSQLKAAFNGTFRELFEKQWANYRKRANRSDPSFKCKLPDFKKEAAEWVVQALDAAARTLWEQKLKHVLTTPYEKRLFMSHYTRQELFANRILCFDDVLTDFYGWMPAVERLWLLCLVFEPEGPEAEHFRTVLTNLWRIYLVCYPAWQAQQRSHDRKKQRDYRGPRTTLSTDFVHSPDDDPESELEKARQRLHGNQQEVDALDLLDVEARFNLERARQRLDAHEQRIFDLITEGSGAPITPQQIAGRLGMPVKEVDRLMKQMTSKLEDWFRH